MLNGGTVIFDEVGLSLEKATLNDLSEAKKVLVEKGGTTLIGVAGKGAGQALADWMALVSRAPQPGCCLSILSY